MKRKRGGDDAGPKPARRGRIPCPKHGCPFRGDSDRAISIHLASKSHRDSDTSEDEARSSSSDASQSVSHSSSDRSVGSEDRSDSIQGQAEHVRGEPPADQSESSAQQGSDGQDASSAGGGSMVSGGSADWPEQGGPGMHIDVSDAGSVSQDSADESELVESNADEQYGFERIAKLPNIFEEALTPILNGLAQRKQDALLKVVTDPEFGPHSIRWRSTAAYKKYMDG